MERLTLTVAMITVSMAIAILLVFMRIGHRENYTESEIITRFKEFSIGLSGNDPTAEPIEGEEVDDVVEMDREVLDIYKAMRKNYDYTSSLATILEYSRSDEFFKFGKLRESLGI